MQLAVSTYANVAFTNFEHDFLAWSVCRYVLNDELELVYRLSVSSYFDSGTRTVVTFTDGDQEYTLSALQSKGVSVAIVGKCQFRLQQDEAVNVLRCFW